MQTLDVSTRHSEHHGQIWAMVRAGLQSLVWWLGAVGLATAAGYPGVVLLTPAAWLLAAGAGYRYALHTSAGGLRPRLRLAALLGAGFGLALGLLCAVVVLGWIPIAADERAITYRLLGAIALIGATIGAVLSSAAAWLVRRRYWS